MLKENISYCLETVIGNDETAIKMESGGLKVYSTPSLIAFMEKTAFLCVENFLDVGDTTVGISINAKHLKANLVGDKLQCTATLTKVDGKKLSFDILVTYKDIVVGSCIHDRFIVNGNKFMDKLVKR